MRGFGDSEQSLNLEAFGQLEGLIGTTAHGIGKNIAPRLASHFANNSGLLTLTWFAVLIGYPGAVGNQMGGRTDWRVHDRFESKAGCATAIVGYLGADAIFSRFQKSRDVLGEGVLPISAGAYLFLIDKKAHLVVASEAAYGAGWDLLEGKFMADDVALAVIGTPKP